MVKLNAFLIIVILLVLLICVYCVSCIYIEPFDDLPESPPTPVSENAHTTIENVHEKIPVVDFKLVQSIKEGLKGIIANKPEVIAAIKDVLSEPIIHNTLMDILFMFKN